MLHIQYITAGRLQIFHFNLWNCGCHFRLYTCSKTVQLCIFYPLCFTILSQQLHITLQRQCRGAAHLPLSSTGVWGGKRSEGKRYTHRLVPHLGVQGRGSGSCCWVREGCMREAWSQLSGVQRVRSPGIRRCWDQCCPCQIIWGSTGKQRADRASTSGRCTQKLHFGAGSCHNVAKKVCNPPPINPP